MPLNTCEPAAHGHTTIILQSPLPNVDAIDIHIMFTVLLLVCVICLALRALVQDRRPRLTTSHPAKGSPSVQELQCIAARHELGAALQDMVEHEGAGSWPPRADHSSWPAPLKPYKQTLDEMLPLLATLQPSLDDDVNSAAIGKFRSLMKEKLSDRIDLAEVAEVLEAAQTGNANNFPQEAYNGFFCCIANSRHAYRWAVLPIVKVAQRETVIDFPPELELAWEHCRQHFGITADSGNNHCNVLCNYSRNGERVFKFATHVSDEVASSEENFFRMFYDLEVLAFPLYYQMALAVSAFDDHDEQACLIHLQDISRRLRDLLQVYYKNMRNSRVGQKIWMRWVQGLQGWAAGKIIDGKFVRFNGISASQVLFFQALDAFLGMAAFLSDTDNERYILAKQRKLVAAFRKHSFRNRMSCGTSTGAAIAEEFDKIVNQVKSFRAAHRTRCLPYLKEPAPERIPMTAGMFQPSTTSERSIGSTNDAYQPLLDLLTSRLRATK